MEKNNQFIGFGLKDTHHDERDIQLGAFVTLPKIEEIPKSFSFDPLEIKDQLDTDFCSAFATCAISELQEGIILDPLWSFAVSKKISGDPQEWGQTVRNALKAHTQYGALPAINSPYSLETANLEQIRDINNWPQDTFQKAVKQRKKSYVEISGPYDHFDNIKASIWRFKEEKRGVVTGIKWHWSSTQVVLEGTGEFGFGHMVAIIGWDERGLKIQNSAGINAGDKGFHYMPREEVNYYVGKFEAFMMVDVEPERLRKCIERGIMIDDNPLVSIWKMIRNIL